jgi:energy-coupling factor transporter ATP-binding protein EcfA2
MPIVIKRFPEPLCSPPFASPEARLAGSQARDTLRSLMLRYCQRRIAGRSVLIAGHRGAGKTTLVKSVIEELFHDQRLQIDARPLFVYLHGPDLVSGLDVLGLDKEEKKDAPPSTTNVIVIGKPDGTFVLPGTPKPEEHAARPPNPAEAGKATPLRSEAQEESFQCRLATLALRQLTVSLHQAFVTHIGWRMQETAHKNRRYEEVAQFRLDLDRQIEVRDLRSFWDRTGVLESGILRSPDAAGTDYKSSQGTLEIIALASLSDAYTRAIAKDVEETEGQQLEEKRERKQEVEKSRDRKELVNSIGSLLSGGAAAAGVASTTVGQIPARIFLAALAFSAASVLTSALLNFTSQRSFSLRGSKERKIIYNDTLGSLELMVPLLIHRVQDAGLAPVFVVDELDKIDDPESKMDLLLKQLKHIVADKAFCCFLVDREYFETVRTWDQATSRSRGLTYFGERLYVIMRHQDWHAYLQYVLEVSEDNRLLEYAAIALRYVLLARSKMHAIDLRREIESLPRRAGSDDEVALGASDILTRPFNQNLLLYQVAVEFLLEEGALGARVASDTNFLQLAYDALYYPLRMWERGGNQIQLDK